MPGTRLVYVADREADTLPLTKRAQGLGNPVAMRAFTPGGGGANSSPAPSETRQ